MMPLVITGFEQLSSSICCRVMASQIMPSLKSFELGQNRVFDPWFWLQLC